MMKKKFVLIIGIILFLLFASLGLVKRQRTIEFKPSPFLDTPGKSPLVKNIKTITQEGGRVDWSPKGDLIAFDRLGEDGYYDVWLMKPDGSDQQCLTCDQPQLPNKHMGNPAWYPTEEWIVFQAEKKKHFGLSQLATPGVGFFSDLWLARSDGSEFYQLTNLPTKQNFFDKTPHPAVLHPRFSHDGQKLFWSQRVAEEGKWGRWVLRIADFTFGNDTPKLFNIKTLTPGKQQIFYESHGFSQDDESIYFSGNLEENQDETGLDIYSLNLQTERLTKLTDSFVDWDEHAQLSPDGTKIVWASSTGYPFDPEKPQNGALDLWLMETSGENKTRLTYFNDPTAPEYLGKQVVAADSSFSPDGKSLMVYVIIDGAKQEGVNFRIELE